jgi:hypothetical protein
MSTNKRLIFASAIVAAVCLAGVLFLVRHIKKSRRWQCQAILQRINYAKEQWTMGTSRTNGDPVDYAKVLNLLNSEALPKCPTGGRYLLGFIGEFPVCTIHKDVCLEDPPIDPIEYNKRLEAAKRAQRIYEQQLRER